MEFLQYLIPLVVLTLIAVILFFRIREYIANSRSPLDSYTVRIVGKRSEVGGGTGNLPVSTRYFVTFEAKTGHRHEFSVSGKEYGLLAEGDVGTLHLQGTWYRGFTRASK